MREKIERLVSDRVVTPLIFVNGIALFLRAFPVLDGRLGSLLFGIDYACSVFFLLEIIAKLAIHGWRPFLASHWNKFDFVVVTASSVFLLAPFLSFQDFSFLLVLRTVRLWRLIRVLKFIPDGERLWLGAMRAVRASVGILVALVVYNFVLGVAACYLFRGTGSPHFADPLSSLYSLFKVFTVEGWYEIPDAIARGTGGSMAFVIRVFFAGAVLTGGLFGLSLANAIFVDQMVSDNTDELERLVGDVRNELAEARAQSARQAQELKALLAALKETLGKNSPPDD